MAGEDDDIEILIPDDDGDTAIPADAASTSKPDATRTAEPSDKVSQVRTADQGISDLQRQLEEMKAQKTQADSALAVERRRAAEAERRATAAAGDVGRWRTHADTARYGEIRNGLDSANNAKIAASTKYQSAMEAGDFKTAAEAQLAMADAAARAVAFETTKAEMEAAAKSSQRAESADGGAVREQHIVDDPVEQFVATLASPRAQAWVRAHPECVTDTRPGGQNTKMVAAHWSALADGIAEGTDSYFDFIDKRMGYKEETKPQQQSRSRSMAAPPSRDVPSNGGGTNPRVITLTKDEREIARLSGLSDKEYAMQKFALQQEGRLGPAATH